MDYNYHYEKRKYKLIIEIKRTITEREQSPRIKKILYT